MNKTTPPVDDVVTHHVEPDTSTVQACLRFGARELLALHKQLMPPPEAGHLQPFEELLVDEITAICRLEAEVLLGFVLAKPQSWLYAWPEHSLNTQDQSRFRQLVASRITGQPVAYLTGFQEFWSMNFKVTPAVLVPRADTELLVEIALEHVRAPEVTDVLELGTGSGAIAISLASAVGEQTNVCTNEDKSKRIYLTATDISKDALEVAKENASRLLKPTDSTITFLQSDWFKELGSDSTRRYQLIISNPPYVRKNDPHLTLPVSGISFEPQCALIAADNGLRDLATIIEGALAFLDEGGLLALEHGHDQAEAVRGLLQHAGYLAIESRTDLADVERVTMGVSPGIKL